MTPRTELPVPTVRPVVVGTGGSTASDAAALAAARTAHQLGAPLRLVRVVPLPSEDPVDERGSGVALRTAAAQLEGLRQALADLLPGLPVTGVMHRGRTGHALVEESWGAERVLLGQHAGPGLGTVAGQLVRQAHAPVLLHRGGPRPSGAVVVGLDTFPGTEAVLGLAADEAVLRGAVLHVVHGRTSRCLGDGRLAGAEQSLLFQLVARVQADRPRLQVHVVSHPEGAVTVLLEAAARAQLLVLGRHRPDAVQLPSSTGETVLLRAPCPVLLVPEDVRAAAGASRTPSGQELVDR